MGRAMKLEACLVMGLVLLMSGLCLAAQSAPAEPRKPDIIQFRLVEDTEGPNTVAMKLKGKDETLHVNKQVLLNALDVRSAKVTHSPNGTPCISLTFTPAGAKRFAKVTAENIGRRLAVIVDGQLLSAPVIKTRVAGAAVIEGDFTLKQAQELAAALNPTAHK